MQVPAGTAVAVGTPPNRAWLRDADVIGAAILLALYVALRTADAPQPVLALWLTAATAFAVAFPGGGLLLVIPVGMFIGPYFMRQSLPAWTVWITAWVVGVLVRVAFAFVRNRTEVLRVYRNPVLLATLALTAASALSVVTTWRHFGRGVGLDAAYRWLWGPGTALLVLLAAAWVIRDGRWRPAAVAVAAGVTGAVVSLVVWFAPTLLPGTAFAWLLGPQTDTTRLHGVTYLATGLEALLIVPAAMLAMAGLFAAGRRTRILAAAGLVPVALAIWFTYNRAGLVGAYVIVVVAAWQARPMLGKVIAAVGIVGGVAVLPFYTAMRGSTLGSIAVPAAGQTLSPSDQMRVDAWAAAVRMWQDAPLLGHGFRSFFRLHETYGSPSLNAPHNDWLRLFAEGGLIAGVAGLAFLVAVVWYLARGRGWVPRAALAAFACWAIALCFNNILSYDQVSIPLMVIVATGVTAVRLERERATAAPGAAPVAASSG
jgi:hypothetical protein